MKKGQKIEAWMIADLATMAAVDNTAVAEMKWEEGSCQSSYPHAPDLADRKEEKPD